MLFVDIGGTFLKFLFHNQVYRIEMPCEKIISVGWIKSQIKNFINKNKIDEIAFSCQMHGYVIEGTDDFITWKNKGEIPPFIDSEKFTLETGLFLRDDLPISNLYAYCKKNSKRKIKICHISEALLDEKMNKCSVEMACGTGFYNLNERKYIYRDKFKELFDVDLVFDQVSYDIREISGLLFHGNKKIKCYVGLGDMQCSLYGVDLNQNQISVNLATGSQISQIWQNETFLKYEARPFFGKTLKCITHIPAGRFFLMFEKIIPDLFEIISSLNLEDVLNSDISFDLNFQNIKISDLTEDNLNKKNFISSLLRSFLDQYPLEKFIENKKEIVLSGGISKKINLIKDYFYQKYHKNIIINEFDDDSLFGLEKLFF